MHRFAKFIIIIIYLQPLHVYRVTLAWILVQYIYMELRSHFCNGNDTIKLKEREKKKNHIRQTAQ